jgi:hypothetical protein
MTLSVPPRIDPVPPGQDRPFWSVMIPTYNPTDLLEKTLRSVLDQDPGPARMEIVVVDDASPNGSAETVVRRLAQDRVRLCPGEVNRGLAANWNRCISLSRGRWVHILHQDDLVRPGFYESLAKADQQDPRPGAALCQHAVIDDLGNWRKISNLEQPTAGVIADWLERIVLYQRVQCAAIVVRREVYEQLGGFRPDLVYALDWEMWVRIARHYPLWYEPTVLACWRVHDRSETARLQNLSQTHADVEKAIGLVKESGLPPSLRSVAGEGLIRAMWDELIQTAGERMTAGDYRSGSTSIRAAWRYDRSLRLIPTYFGLAKWALKLWFLDRLVPFRRTSPN